MTIVSVERLSDLTPERRQAILSRSMEEIGDVFDNVRQICEDIRKRGDQVSLEHYKKLKDDIAPGDLKVTRAEIDAAYEQVGDAVVDQLRFVAANIEKFHRAQFERDMWSVEIAPGILAGRITRPMDSAGCYIPGRQANYPSSVLMTIIPAKVAGVQQIVACTPPDTGMVANNASLVAADIAGCEHIFKIGGPWAVASMAYGTELVPKVDKIVGPGNKYVTAAKMAVFGSVAIDSPAGPSEILILADDTANPEWLAMDFYSQVEHDQDAAAVLVTPDAGLAQAVADAINDKFKTIARREILAPALEHNSAILVADTMDDAIAFTNEYATEHLEVVTRDPMLMLPRIKHAGSIFLGPYAPVPVGDYASGTNHVLPTGQCARMFSGLSTDDFIKKPTWQFLSKDGLKHLSEAVLVLSEAEGLPLHGETVRVRLEE
ncbi:MAG: histidinol dehydrogenase [Armatimonadetes bacterium]|jgi:histidinol dehydrogenase|nr:histidinol dehydrogenase [Armatimonadota bacterium]MDI9585036.1 histidinol dehydrogenase [Acidobacteriota bacterium]